MSWLQKVSGPSQKPDLKNKTVLLVGPTSGVGEALAHQLADANANLVLAGRSPEKLAALKNSLQRKTTASVQTVQVDLANLNSIKHAAAELNASVSRIDLLIANAGVLYLGSERRFTDDGFELCMGVNHLGNAALILAVEDLIKIAAPARVVIVASEAHRRAGAQLIEDLMSERKFTDRKAYSRSKLANILFARELARQWQSSGVIVYSAHPGGVDTPMMDTTANANAFTRTLKLLLASALISADEAATGIMRIATDPAVNEETGTYFELGRANRGSEQSRDVALAQQLWQKTGELLKLW